MDRYSSLIRALREHLRPADIAALKGEPCPEEGYEAPFRRARRRAKKLEEHVGFGKRLVEDRYEDLVGMPKEQQETLFRNCSPTLLLVIAHDLMNRSYEARFSDTAKALSFADLAVEIATLLRRTNVLGAEAWNDLMGEAKGRLGNARRITGDLVGAGKALAEAQTLLEDGTRDRDLRADLMKFQAMLASASGQGKDAATLLDREIKLRRLLGDQEKLGAAFIDRGQISCWMESLELACDFMMSGANLVTDPRSQLVALHSLARRLARDRDGEYAWLTLSSSILALAVVNEPRFRTEHRWIKGLTFRALGRLDDAERELEAACGALSQSTPDIAVAFASVDLACVLIAQRKFTRARECATRAWGLFVEQRVALPMLSALLALVDAIRGETATEALALDVADFLGRYQLDHRLRFRVRRR